MTIELLHSIVQGDMHPDDIDESSVDTLAQAARREGVGSLLYQLTHFPALREHAAYQSATYALQRRAAKTMQQALDTANIPVIWLKGIVLAETVYPFAQTREMLDLDLYVQHDQIDSVLNVFAKEGYSKHLPENKLFQEHETLTTHHITVVNEHNIFFEIHRQLLKLEAFSPDEDWFWQQVTSFEIDGTPFRSFTPEAHLLYLCAHALLHHTESELLIRHYLDIHYLIVSKDLNWSIIIEQAVRFKWTYAVQRLLVKTQVYLNTPIPEEVIKMLNEKRSLDEDVRLIMHLNHPANMKLKKLIAELKSHSWHRRIRIVWRIVFPPRFYMRQHYRHLANHAVWQLYLYRIFDESRLLIQAVARGKRL